MKLLAIALVSTSLAATCAPEPAPAPKPHLDAGLGSCETACSTLSFLGCKEGLAPNCVAACNHAQTAGLADMHTGCLAAATSKEEARLCKSVACP